MPVPGLRSWLSLERLSGTSWFMRGVAVLLLGAALLSAFFGGRARSWLVGLWLLAFVAHQVFVWRRGGWQLLGPHFYYDVVRLARRGRSTVLRVFYIIAMFVGLAYVYETSPAVRANDFAHVSEKFAFTLFLTQNLAIMILTPAYLGSAITEEKERRTLELLFTTHLNNTEIILGKLFSRTIHLVGFVIAGFPILSLMQFWGGIDMLLIAGNLANTLLNILSIGSLCLFFSSLSKTVAGAVMTSYAVILPIGFCCMASLRGFPFVLQDARTGSGNVTVQDLAALAIAHFAVTSVCLTLAMIALREQEPFSPLPRDVTRGKDRSEPEVVGTPLGMPALASAFQTAVAVTVAGPEAPKPRPILPRPMEPLDDFSIPYTLPPVTDNALMWKERFVGGPPLVMSPIMLVPAIPFIATGAVVMGVFLVHAFLSNEEDYRRAIEIWSIVLRFFYYVFLGCFLLGVCNRATSSVARERQQQTLDPLLLLPIDRREILWTKWLGSVWRGWPWLTLLLGDLVIGTLVGAYHPFSAVLLFVGAAPLIAFFASLGMLISVTASTVLRANLVMVTIVVLFVAATMGGIASQSPLAYLETFAFSLWSAPDPDTRRVLITLGVIAGYVLAAIVCWLLALRQFENRARDTST